MGTPSSTNTEVTPPDVYTARTPKAAARLEAFDRVWRLPIILSAILPIVLVTATHQTFANAVSVIAWLVFVVDLVVHMRLIRRYLRTGRGVVDLVIVILTAPWFLIPGFESTAILMLARLGRLVRVVAVGPGKVLFERLGRVFFVALGVVFVCSGVAYRAEHAANPGFATFGDALWWGIVTLTTVGYGDIVPKTTTGRVAGIVIMVTGVAVLGLLAGNLASFLRLQPHSTASPGATEPLDVPSRLDVLHADVARLTEAVDRLTRQGAGPAMTIDEPDEPASDP